MDCGQNLSLPKDIAWERLAFSPDMFDTNFKDPGLPPKWRTSLAAFYYVVPEEETKEVYPDRKIMYLRVIASITGCNFTSEGLLADEFVDDYFDELRINGVLDPFQASTLKIVTGKLSDYYPCRGAILQVAVFPHIKEGEEENVNLWEYPYIQDFEPKKRELYETVSKSGEVLSGSSSALNLKKGTTTTDSLEESDISSHSVEVEAGTGLIPSAFATGKTKYGYKTEHATKKHTGKEESHLTSTDSSREKRETQSYTTNINQMYQPLLAYHLGTNRALWTISPRPHTVDSEFNLIDVYVKPEEVTQEGTIIGRKLEGIQDMFLVINMPKDSKGLCFQASLDTGYDVYRCIDHHYPVVVMRRVIKSCGKFDDQGNFKIDYYPYPNVVRLRHLRVVNEFVMGHMVHLPYNVLYDTEKKADLVFKANERSQYIMQGMLGGYSSRAYKPRAFVESDTFKAIVESNLKESTYKLSELEFVVNVELGQLKDRRILTVGDLMSADYEKEPVVQSVRKKILESAAEISKNIAKYQREQFEEEEEEEEEECSGYIIADCAVGLGQFDQESGGYPVKDDQELYNGKPTCKAVDVCGIQAHAGYYLIGSGGNDFGCNIDKFPYLNLTMKAEKDTDTCLLLMVHDKKPSDYMRRFVMVGKTPKGHHPGYFDDSTDCFTIKEDGQWHDYTYDLRKLKKDYPNAETIRIVQFYSYKYCNGTSRAFHLSRLELCE